MAKETTTVKILGASYKIACPPEESEEVKKAAVFLDNKLNEVKQGSGLDEKRAAIITALNISNEYLKNLSNGVSDEATNESLENLTLEVKKQLENLSFKA
jgi:cell division protein ZapA|tara:strand:+ start:5577 stop:5876 length:300 start_codon:yes stop_codon:yes gene_type:complete